MDERVRIRKEIGQTSSSAKVNRCLRITTLSHLELVSAIVDGSSSSQSASLLIHMAHFSMVF